MFGPSFMSFLFIVFIVGYFLSSAIKILKEYERGVVFRLGRIIDLKGPGLVIIWPVIDKLVKVSLRTITMDVPPQDIITRDNITVKVNAVVYLIDSSDPTRFAESKVELDVRRFGPILPIHRRIFCPR